MEILVRFSNVSYEHEPYSNDMGYDYECLQNALGFYTFPWEIYSAYHLCGTYFCDDSVDIPETRNPIYNMKKKLEKAYTDRDYKLIFLFHLLIENWPVDKKYLHIAER
jgi:hypothetical protein